MPNRQGSYLKINQRNRKFQNSKQHLKKSNETIIYKNDNQLHHKASSKYQIQHPIHKLNSQINQIKMMFKQSQNNILQARKDYSYRERQKSKSVLSKSNNVNKKKNVSLIEANPNKKIVSDGIISCFNKNNECNKTKNLRSYQNNNYIQSSLQQFTQKLRQISYKYSKDHIISQQSSKISNKKNLTQHLQSSSKKSNFSISFNESKTNQIYNSNKYHSKEISKEPFFQIKSYINFKQIGKIRDIQSIHNQIAFASTKHQIIIFTVRNSPSSLARKYLFQQDNQNIDNHTQYLKGHRRPVTKLYYDICSAFFYSGSLDSMIKIWDIQKKENIFTIKNHKAPIIDLLPINDQCLFSYSNKLSIFQFQKRIQVRQYPIYLNKGKLFYQQKLMFSSQNNLFIFDEKSKKPVLLLKIKDKIKFWKNLSKTKILAIGYYLWIGNQYNMHIIGQFKYNQQQIYSAVQQKNMLIITTQLHILIYDIGGKLLIDFEMTKFHVCVLNNGIVLANNKQLLKLYIK